MAGSYSNPTQSIMRTKKIWADTIDGAAEEILNTLKEKADTSRSVSSRDNVFYFDGWDGLGASAVLRAIATPTSPSVKRALSQLKFDQVIHIDFSMWESRRALQRAVAEQLKLPDEVMELFDRQDEQDDFRGVAQGSRSELGEVVREMHQHIQKLNHRFLLIFHNGSSEEIDLASCCGFTLSGFSTNKVLWTFQGRFRLKPRMKVDIAMKSAGTTDAFIWATSYEWEHNSGKLWSYLIDQEATEVAASLQINTRPHGTIDHQPARVSECFLYMLELCGRCHNWIDYDFSTHGANYLVCDGIIHQPNGGERDIGLDDDNDESWRDAEALQREIQLDVDYHQFFPSSLLARFVAYWTSPKCGLTRIAAGGIPNGDMFFQHCSDKLRVLKLSRCTFNFQSPPFVCCHSLRFLWLDHCRDTAIKAEGAGKEEEVRRCFQRLWVLDVRYTDHDQILSVQMLDLMTQLRELNVMGARDWDVGQLHGRLPNIRKLRVTKSTIHCSCSENDLFLDMKKMELLDFSGNKSSRPFITTLSGAGPWATSNNSCLETVIIDDGCLGLRQISFRGCTKMKNLFLGGEMVSLRTIDISGTPVKTLDLTTTNIFYLEELHLLGCINLCAILWPPKDKMTRSLNKVCIDTTREEKVNGGSAAAAATQAAAAPHEHGNGRRSSDFGWDISVKDARLLFSLESVYEYDGFRREAHVEVSSPARPTVTASGSKDEGIKSNSNSEPQAVVSLQGQTAPAIYGADSTMDHLQQASKGDGDAPGIASMWPCPDLPSLPERRCYMHIQDQMRTQVTRGGEKTGTITVPRFVVGSAKILHVHDCLSIAAIPSATVDWSSLEWCTIKRCPKLESVLHNTESTVVYRLRTFWASQLLKACYIRKWSGSPGLFHTFPYLTFLHLDCCPRLIHAFPLSKLLFNNDSELYRLWSRFGLNQLETIEIMWCGDLEGVFPLDDTDAERHMEQLQPPITVPFPKLKHIHLHELPSLRRICGGVRMSAPNLETVKIRGCWSLKRLPIVDGGNKAVECDCEKEWWEKLEWDHHRSPAWGYKPIHPRHYKKSLLRGSVLR